MQSLGFRQTLPDQFYVPLRGGNATFRFLLERMQHVNRFRETHRVDGAPSIAALMRNNLDDGASAKSTQGLRRGIGFTLLRSENSSADVAADRARKFAQVSSTRAHPDNRAFRIPHIYLYTSICMIQQ